MPTKGAITVLQVLQTVIAATAVITIGTGAISDYGWVTKRTYVDDQTKTVAIADYTKHVKETDAAFAAQDKQNAAISGSLNEIKALLTVVPQLKALIRIKCSGGRGLDATIDDLKVRYRSLTGAEYQVPVCGSPDLESR